MQKYLEEAGVDFQFNTEVTNVIFEFKDDKKIASAIECKVNGVEKGIVLTENDSYSSQTEAVQKVRSMVIRTMHRTATRKFVQAAAGPSGKISQRRIHLSDIQKKFCSDISKTNWESATVTTLDDKIIPYITDICKRDPRTGKVVTGGIVSCQDSKWLLSWTINRQGQFKDQTKISLRMGLRSVYRRTWRLCQETDERLYR